MLAPHRWRGNRLLGSHGARRRERSTSSTRAARAHTTWGLPGRRSARDVEAPSATAPHQAWSEPGGDAARSTPAGWQQRGEHNVASQITGEDGTRHGWQRRHRQRCAVREVASGWSGVGVSSRHSFDARALHRPTFSASPWRTLVADGLCAGACAGVCPLAQNMHKTLRKEGGVHPGDASTTPWCSASLHRCADRRGACSLAITRWRITPPPHGGRRWKTQP